MNATKETSLFQDKTIERAEFLRKVGLMALVALLSGWLTNEVVNNVEKTNDDFWAGDYRGV